MKQNIINTGFNRHIDILCDFEGELPNGSEHAKMVIGEECTEKWFNVKELGYEKDWMYVCGK